MANNTNNNNNVNIDINDFMDKFFSKFEESMTQQYRNLTKVLNSIERNTNPNPSVSNPSRANRDLDDIAKRRTRSINFDDANLDDKIRRLERVISTIDNNESSFKQMKRDFKSPNNMEIAPIVKEQYTRVNTLQVEMKDATDTLKQLYTEESNLQKELTKLTNKLNTAADNKKDSEQILEIARQTLDNAQNKLKTNQQVINDETKAIEDSNKTLNDLNNTYNDLSTELTTFEETIKKLKEDFKDLSGFMFDDRQQALSNSNLDDNIKANLQIIIDEINKTQNKKDAVENKRLDTNNAINEQIALQTRSKTNINNATSNIVNLQDEINTAQTNVNNAQAENDKANKEYNATQIDVNNAQVRLNDFQINNRNDINELEKIIETNQENINITLEEYDKDMNAYQQLIQSTSFLPESVQRMRNFKISRANRHKELTEAVQGADNILAGINNQKTNLIASRERNNKFLTKYNTEISTLEDTTDEHGNIIKEGEVTKKFKESEQADKDLQQAENNAITLDSEVNKANEEVINLTETNTNLITYIDKLTKEIQELTNNNTDGSNDELIKQKQAELSIKQTEQSSLEDKITDAVNNAETIRQKSEDAHRSVQTATENAERKKAEATAAKDRLARLKDRSKVLKEQNELFDRQEENLNKSAKEITNFRNMCEAANNVFVELGSKLGNTLANSINSLVQSGLNHITQAATTVYTAIEDTQNSVAKQLSIDSGQYDDLMDSIDQYIKDKGYTSTMSTADVANEVVSFSDYGIRDMDELAAMSLVASETKARGGSINLADDTNIDLMHRIYQDVIDNGGTEDEATQALSDAVTTLIDYEKMSIEQTGSARGYVQGGYNQVSHTWSDALITTGADVGQFLGQAGAVSNALENKGIDSSSINDIFSSILNNNITSLSTELQAVLTDTGLSDKNNVYAIMQEENGAQKLYTTLMQGIKDLYGNGELDANTVGYLNEAFGSNMTQQEMLKFLETFDMSDLEVVVDEDALKTAHDKDQTALEEGTYNSATVKATKIMENTEYDLADAMQNIAFGEDAMVAGLNSITSGISDIYKLLSDTLSSAISSGIGSLIGIKKAGSTVANTAVNTATNVATNTATNTATNAAVNATTGATVSTAGTSAAIGSALTYAGLATEIIGAGLFLKGAVESYSTSIEEGASKSSALYDAILDGFDSVPILNKIADLSYSIATSTDEIDAFNDEMSEYALSFDEISAAADSLTEAADAERAATEQKLKDYEQEYNNATSASEESKVIESMLEDVKKSAEDNGETYNGIDYSHEDLMKMSSEERKNIKDNLNTEINKKSEQKATKNTNIASFLSDNSSSLSQLSEANYITGGMDTNGEYSNNLTNATDYVTANDLDKWFDSKSTSDHAQDVYNKNMQLGKDMATNIANNLFNKVDISELDRNGQLDSLTTDDLLEMVYNIDTNDLLTMPIDENGNTLNESDINTINTIVNEQIKQLQESKALWNKQNDEFQRRLDSVTDNPSKDNETVWVDKYIKKYPEAKLDYTYANTDGSRPTLPIGNERQPWPDNTGKYAIGLDYVPKDNFPALLHKGEMVLNKKDAEQFRQQQNKMIPDITDTIYNSIQNTLNNNLSNFSDNVNTVDDSIYTNSATNINTSDINTVTEQDILDSINNSEMLLNSNSINTNDITDNDSIINSEFDSAMNQLINATNYTPEAKSIKNNGNQAMSAYDIYKQITGDINNTTLGDNSVYTINNDNLNTILNDVNNSIIDKITDINSEYTNNDIENNKQQLQTLLDNMNTNSINTNQIANISSIASSLEETALNDINLPETIAQYIKDTNTNIDLTNAKSIKNVIDEYNHHKLLQEYEKYANEQFNQSSYIGEMPFKLSDIIDINNNTSLADIVNAVTEQYKEINSIDTDNLNNVNSVDNLSNILYNNNIGKNNILTKSIDDSIKNIIDQDILNQNAENNITNDDKLNNYINDYLHSMDLISMSEENVNQLIKPLADEIIRSEQLNNEDVVNQLLNNSNIINNDIENSNTIKSAKEDLQQTIENLSSVDELNNLNITDTDLYNELLNKLKDNDINNAIDNSIMTDLNGNEFNEDLATKMATGFDYIPTDDYPALLHQGEMVLNKKDAERYRDGKSDFDEITDNMTELIDNQIDNDDYNAIISAISSMNTSNIDTTIPMKVNNTDVVNSINKLGDRVENLLNIVIKLLPSLSKNNGINSNISNRYNISNAINNMDTDTARILKR